MRLPTRAVPQTSCVCTLGVCWCTEGLQGTGLPGARAFMGRKTGGSLAAALVWRIWANTFFGGPYGPCIYHLLATDPQ